MGIKNLLELLEGLRIIGVRFAFIARGGLEVKDFTQLVKLVQDWPTLKLAYDDLPVGINEGGDIDTAEALTLGTVAIKVYKDIGRANRGEDPDVILGKK